MAGFEDKLSEILSSPESMEQIFALAKSFEGGGREASSEGQKAAFPSGIDPKMMELLGRVMGEYGREDKTVAALGAIKPFLKEEKQARVDKAMELAKLARVAKLALGGAADV